MMRRTSALGLIALGALLVFAITAHPHHINLHAAGWVIILLGIAGLIPGRYYGQVRQRVVHRPETTTTIRRPSRIPLPRPGRIYRRSTVGPPTEEVVEETHTWGEENEE